MIDADNPLDKISGEITLYQMSGTSWNKKLLKVLARLMYVTGLSILGLSKSGPLKKNLNMT